MTRNAEPPETSAADAPPPAPARRPQSGPVAELGLVAAGLGLVVYLIGFVADVGGSSSLVLPLLLGGGLLAGSVALPATSNRVLVPAAVATTTGALLLLRAVVDDGGSALAVGALVLGLLEAAAAVGATLMDSGVLRARPPKARKAAPPAFAGYPGGPQFPGQQYPGQPYPGPYPAEQYNSGDQWIGEHAYAQNARYGGQYGVPGYPPPPPQAAPEPAPAGGVEPGDTPSPPQGTRPVTEPVAGTAEPGSGPRAADPGTGGFPTLSTEPRRAVPDPGAAFRPEIATHRAVPDPGAGSHRPGYHPEAGPDAGAPEGAHTRAIPTVPDEKR